MSEKKHPSTNKKYHDVDLRGRDECPVGPESSSRLEHIDTLVRLGALQYFDKVETMHGRAVDSTEPHSEWRVALQHKNGPDREGKNIYTRRALYTGDTYTASVYAKIRTEEKSASGDPTSGIQYQPRVYPIASHIKNATILDLTSFFPVENLSLQNREAYRSAIEELAPSLTEGAPVCYGEVYLVKDVYKVLGEHFSHPGNSIITERDIHRNSERIGHLNKNILYHLVGAHNMRKLIWDGYKLDALIDALMYNHEGTNLSIEYGDGDRKTHVPVNTAYGESFFQANNIIGFSQRFHSGASQKPMKATVLLDLEKINRKEVVEQNRKRTADLLGGVAVSLCRVTEKLTVNSYKDASLVYELRKTHGRPEDLVAAAMYLDRHYDTLFKMDAGNWEKFTLAEHTETVLRNFEENYADNIPAILIPPMRLTLLIHDIGKSLAASRGNKALLQDTYNRLEGEAFLDKIGVDQRGKELILAMAGEGMKLAGGIVTKKEGADRLVGFCKEILEDFHENSENSSRDDMPNLVKGFAMVCIMLAVCDGGAYTDKALTRDASSGHYYKNPPVFNSTFEKAQGFSRRKLII